MPFIVTEVIGNTVYKIKSTKPLQTQDREVIAHATHLRRRLAIDQSTTTNLSGPTKRPTTTSPTSPSAPLKDDKDIVYPFLEEIVMWKDVDQKRFYLGIVKDCNSRTQTVTVHTLNTSQRSKPVHQRKYLKGWRSTIDNRVVHQTTKPAKAEPELCDFDVTFIVERDIKLTAQHTIPLNICNKYKVDSDECVLLTAEEKDDRDFSHVIYDEDHAFTTATTHQQIDYHSLTEKEIEEMQHAREAELKKFVEYKVYTAVPASTVPKHIKTLPVRFVDTRKLKDGKRIFKSRLVARGDLDDRSDLLTTTGACPQDHIRLNLLMALSSPNWDPKNIRIIDVRNAYLQAKIDNPDTETVYLMPPIGHPDRTANKVWRLHKYVYGLKDAGAGFARFLEGKLKQLDYTSIIDGIWTKTDKLTGQVLYSISVFVDDMCCAAIYGDIDKCEAEIRSKLDCQPSEPLKRCVGVDYELGDNFIRCSQVDYARSLDVTPGQVPPQPLPSNVLERDENPVPITEKRNIKKYRSDLGAYSYLASTTRPDLLFSAAYLSKFMTEPTFQARRLLDGALRYAQTTADVSLLLKKPTDLSSFRLVTYVDASLGSDLNPLPSLGYIVLHEGTPIAAKSAKSKRVARSSTKSEVLALCKAVDYLSYIKPFLKLFFKNVHLEIHCDSADTIALIAAAYPRPAERALIHQIRETHGKLLVVPLFALAEQFSDEKILLFKVNTHDNVADALTKPMCVSAIYKLLTPTKISMLHSDDTNSDDDNMDIPIINVPTDTQESVTSASKTSKRIFEKMVLRPRHLLQKPKRYMC